jgi:ABC-type multidrug transport system ATPase subunit
LDSNSGATSEGAGFILFLLQILGLDICADTMVGDDLRRGISGGQKKRVTTGMGIINLCHLWLPDAVKVCPI